MRKTRVLVALGFGLLVAPMVMGATVSFVGITPNPNGQKSVLAANGSYTLGNNEVASTIQFQATVKNSFPTQSLFLKGRNA